MLDDSNMRLWSSAHYLSELRVALEDVSPAEIDRAVDLLWKNYSEGRRLAFCGNGGSAATASHLPADLQKNILLLGGRPWECLSLTDSIPLITAWSNDVSFEQGFAGQVRVWMRSGDVLIAISGSGNSPNILAAVQAARDNGAVTIGLSGFGGGKLASVVDHSIVVPIHQMQIVEDVHMAICHAIYVGLVKRLELRS